MSLLVEIAARADVPLESVVRVLTREPVNDDHKGRILAALDSLDPEETRVLQRFALAAVHDALPHPASSVDHEAVVAELIDDPLVLPEAVRLELGPGAETEEVEEAEFDEPQPPATLEAAPLVQLRSVLEELTEAVRDLRRETDAERRERVDDLAVVIDLITKGWEGVDRRLGRLERQLGRLEAAEPRRGLPGPLPSQQAALEPPPVPAPPGPPTPDGPGPDPEPEGTAVGSALRHRLPLAVLVFGVAIGALAAFDLPSRFDASAVTDPPSREGDPAPRLVPPLSQTTTPSTGSVLGTETGSAEPATTAARTTTGSATTGRATAPAPTSEASTTQARTTQPRATTQQTQPRSASGAFTPSRNWAWPPTAGADYYLVEFFRAGQTFYTDRPSEPRLTLPAQIRFTPGIYRWRVRPGRGARSENRLDEPIVDSEFVVPR